MGSTPDPPIKHEPRREGKPSPSSDERFGYRSKACVGLTFFSKAQEEAGVPPICVGVPYWKTSAQPETTEKTTDKLGTFKFACVGYSQRAFPFYPTQGEGGKPRGDGPRRTDLPYCEGLQILVADKVTPGLMDKRHAAARGRDRLDGSGETAEDGKRRPRDDQLDEAVEQAVEMLARDLDRKLGTRQGTPSSTSEERREGDAPGQGGKAAGQSPSPPQTSSEKLRAYVEGSKGPGLILPSAEFEQKFAKSAGKIWKNMKRHAAYIANLAGGVAGGGLPGGGSPREGGAGGGLGGGGR